MRAPPSRWAHRPRRSGWAVMASLGSALALAGCAADDPPTRQHAALEAYRASSRVVGVAAAAVTAQRVLWSEASGLADRERELAVTPQSIFLIASVSKAVLAVGALALVEDGKLALDVDIDRYLPFPIANPAHPLVPITARQLLAHVSSISDLQYQRNAARFYTFGADPTLSLADFIRGFFAADGAYLDPDTFAATAPGTAYEYSNVGFALLGYVLERAAGEPLPAFMQRRVFTPLGMTHTSYRLAGLPADQLVMPYGPGGATGHYTFADFPDGGVRASVLELAAFLRMVMGKGTLEGTRVLSEASVQELLRLQVPTIEDAGAQALGWDVRELARRSFYGHAGGETGVAAAMYFDREADLGVILLDNRSLDDHADAFAQLFSTLVDLSDAAR
jgi:CubicO group peptidase (beta-lactamase class C family)